jgi:hypothetical protein
VIPPEREFLWRGWIIGLLILGPLAYWLLTGQVWEDFLITFRASHNLATGLGLTYEPGTRVHCFTSPLNVLLPALLDWMTRSGGFAVPLAIYNLLAVVSFATGGWVIFRLMRSVDGRIGPAAILFPLLLVCCHRTTAFVVNGQEAGFWVMFLTLAFTAVVRGHDQNWTMAGLSWGGLMWTRPDSPVHIAIFAGVALILCVRERRAEFIGLIKAAGVCAVVYVPWFAWAWWYYGSPVPHSLQAKIGAYLSPDLPWPVIPAIQRVRDVFAGIYAPAYGLDDADWGAVPLWTAALIGLVTALAWVLPGVSRLTRCASACFAGTLLFLGFIWSRGTAFPWYFVPACLFAAIVLARLPFEVMTSRRAWIVAAIPLVVAAQFFVFATQYYKVQQELVENGVRKPLGLWLREHMRPEERLFLEPIGYIGYFSGAKLYDYPGLTSPDVVRLRRRGLEFYELIAELRPTWLVLRSIEYYGLTKRPQIAAQYHVEGVVDQRAALQAHPVRRGGDMAGDARFYVLVRNDRPAIPAR